MTVKQIDDEMAKQQRIHNAAKTIVELLDALENDFDAEAREAAVNLVMDD